MDNGKTMIQTNVFLVGLNMDTEPHSFLCKSRIFSRHEAEFVDREVSRLLHCKHISICDSQLFSPTSVVAKHKSFHLVTYLWHINKNREHR